MEYIHVMSFFFWMHECRRVGKKGGGMMCMRNMRNVDVRRWQEKLSINRAAQKAIGLCLAHCNQANGSPEASVVVVLTRNCSC